MNVSYGGGGYVPTGLSDAELSRIHLDTAATDKAAAEDTRRFNLTRSDRERALQGMLDAINGIGDGGGSTLSASRGGSGGGGAAGVGGGYAPYDDTADTKSYARAKDNTGLALQSALKGLHATMASRGISGSGIEGAETEKLYASGLTDLANTDASQAGKTSEHAFADRQSSKALAEQGREFDAGQSNEMSRFQASFASDTASKKLSALMQAYGSLY